MVKLTVLTLIISAFYSVAFSQSKIDSLHIALAEAQSPKIQVQVLDQLVLYHKYNAVDSAIAYAMQAIAIAAENQISHELKDLYINLGAAYYVKGDYNLSLKAFQKAYEQARTTNNQHLLARSLNSLGAILIMQKQVQKAIAHHLASIPLCQELGLHHTLVSNYLNLGIIYHQEGFHEKALHYIDLGKHSAVKYGDELMLPRLLGREGEILFDFNDLHKALAAFQEGLSSPALTKWDEGFIYSGMARAYLALGEDGKAIEAAEKSVEIGHQVNSFWDLQRAYEVLAKANENTGNFPLAYQNSLQFKAYSDSLFNREKDQEINFLLYKEAELENQLLAKENVAVARKFQLQQVILWDATFAVILLGLLAFVFYKSKEAQRKLLKELRQSQQELAARNKELLKLNSTKDTLFSIISHDIRGPISSLKSVLHLASTDKITPEQQQNFIGRLTLAVSATEELLVNLLYWARSQMQGMMPKQAPTLVGPIVRDQLKAWEPSALSKNIALYFEDKEEIQVYADPNHLGLIIRNLISNAVKFTPENGKVTISCAKARDKKVAIKVADTGVGIATNKLNKLFTNYGNEISERGTNNETGTGLGLNLCYDFALANKGSISVDSIEGEGTTFTLILPETSNGL